MPDSALHAAPARPGVHPAWPGYVLVLTGATCFIVNAGVSKVVLTAGVEPAQLTALRCTGTALGLLLLLVATGRTRRPGWWPRPQELPLLLGYGLVGVALLQWTYFVAIDRLPVGIALLLEYTAPVLIALWARTVGREPVRPTVWVALALSLVGLAMVARVWDGGYLDTLGVVAALAADPEWRGQLLEAPELLGVESLEADRVVLRVLVKCAPAEAPRVSRELRARVAQAFAAAGVGARPDC